jgi:hypothetical protein
MTDHTNPGWAFWRAGGDRDPQPLPPAGCRRTPLGGADGLLVILAESAPGYVWQPHVHGFPEFLLVLEGTVSTEGRLLGPGDGYAAATGSSHTDFATEGGAVYLLITRGATSQ